MVSIRKIFGNSLFYLIIFIMFSGSVTGWAKSVSVMPSLEMKGEMNDNVLFRATREIDDYVAVVRPSVSLNVQSERWTLDTVLDAEIERYQDESDLDTEKQYYSFGGNYQVRERTLLSGRALYIDDTTLDSELLETGILIDRDDRQRYDLQAGINHRLSERFFFDLSYKYGRTDYDAPDRTEHDSNTIALVFGRMLDNQVDYLSVEPLYSEIDSDLSEIKNFGVSLGWNHTFSETLKLKTILGVRYTEADSKVTGENDENWGGTVDVGFDKKGEGLRASGGYRRNIGYSSRGELIEVDKIYGKFFYRITERFDLQLNGNFIFSTSEADFQDEDSTFAEVTPSLNYDLTEKHTAFIAYRFSWNKNESNTQDQEANRSRVWVGVKLKFPKTW